MNYKLSVYNYVAGQTLFILFKEAGSRDTRLFSFRGTERNGRKVWWHSVSQCFQIPKAIRYEIFCTEGNYEEVAPGAIATTLYWPYWFVCSASYVRKCASYIAFHVNSLIMVTQRHVTGSRKMNKHCCLCLVWGLASWFWRPRACA